jgi:hypothetical protein
MKTKNELGRLSRVDLRKVFTSEAGDFTPWLALPENLKLLSETVGLILEYEAQEKYVGPYRADILCRDAGENWVLIENQIEKTDHTHLGQILTYTAGLEAVTIIWIAHRFTDEHRAALDWLNEHTDERINFFGLEIELWQIADSPVAPKFNIVSQPNDWSRTVKAAATQGGEISEHNQLQLRFWTAFREYMEKNSQIRCHKPSTGHWMSHSIGRSGIHLNSIISTWNSVTNRYGPEIRVELYFSGANARQHFAAIEQKRELIERAIGSSLTWHNPPGNKQFRIYTRQDADFLNESLWPQQQKWLKDNLELFKNVFSPFIQKLGESEAGEALVAETI